ncbi:MAG: PD-(D/E)XK nuclease family protein [Bacteroidota bacterium]
MKPKLTDEQVEREIREAFELNYEMLQLEGGHSLTPETRNMALQQVLLYWKKLRSVAESVTDTEVKLTLPEQSTPKKRKFTIEGVVDIVKEEGETWMYDLKTHDATYVRANKDLYERQLNVYAHIWQNLRGQRLDHTAIIATAFPDELNKAVRTNDAKMIEHCMKTWEPLIPIDVDQKHVDAIIADFATVVDEIEENKFNPPDVARLKRKDTGDDQLFATRVCRNCDARFSCSSFREYAMGTNDRGVSAYRKYINDLGDDVDVEDWKTVNLEQSQFITDLEVAAAPIVVNAKQTEKIKLHSDVLNFAPLFSYIKKHKEIPHKKEPEFAPYMKLYKELVADIANMPGWYIWVNAESKKNKIVYIGQSYVGKSAPLRSRIQEEMLDEYVALWGTVHDPVKAERTLDEKYKYKYTKEIARSAKKVGATHIVWCGMEGLTANQLDTIEYNLIEKWSPVANHKRLKYPESYPELLSNVEETLNKLIIKL